jgi:hypothetical protein
MVQNHKNLAKLGKEFLLKEWPIVVLQIVQKLAY